MKDLHLCESKQFPWSVIENRSKSVKTLCTYPGCCVSLVRFQSIQNLWSLYDISSITGIRHQKTRSDPRISVQEIAGPPDEDAECLSTVLCPMRQT